MNRLMEEYIPLLGHYQKLKHQMLEILTDAELGAHHQRQPEPGRVGQTDRRDRAVLRKFVQDLPIELRLQESRAGDGEEHQRSQRLVWQPRRRAKDDSGSVLRRRPGGDPHRPARLACANSAELGYLQGSAADLLRESLGALAGDGKDPARAMGGLA